jgi:hypothetical protein
VEHRHPKSQYRQQPRFDVVELRPSRGRPGHIEAPRLDCEDVDSSDDPLGVGVGVGR